jgi:putative mRNA 3-end processing factor
MQLIEFTEQGLYCRVGDFYIDPWRPVDRAIITHAHSDHAKPGCKSYLCHHDTAPLLKLRLGAVNVQTLEWNESISINNVKVSLHPAGHVIGSAQIKLEYNNRVWVVSGDYKTEDDGLSGAFEPVVCNTFITESTFGLPIYNWKPQTEIYTGIQQWITDNQQRGKASVIFAYSLGKAQRVLNCVAGITNRIFVHGAVWNVHQALVNSGWKLPGVQRVSPDTPVQEFKKGVIIAPPGADGTSWMNRFTPYSTGICSGWMQVRGNMRRRNADAGFALSDHADWPGLLSAIKATRAENIYVTHGFQAAFSRYLNENGLMAAEVKTEFGGEEEEAEKSSLSQEQQEEINNAGDRL